mmetsp:Transcript_49649/g.92948  ORF Transcript_49649/g.92948 Transcript_49649/m.92948 type:complete len:224 (+) Transcript_49649:119-790(+)
MTPAPKLSTLQSYGLPKQTSGATNPAEPQRRDICCSSDRRQANPKSATMGTSPACSNIFSVLMSRCTMSKSCIRFNPLRIPMKSGLAMASVIMPTLRTWYSKSPPGARSNTPKNRTCSISIRQKIPRNPIMLSPCSSTSAVTSLSMDSKSEVAFICFTATSWPDRAFIWSTVAYAPSPITQSFSADAIVKLVSKSVRKQPRVLKMSRKSHPTDPWTTRNQPVT